MLTERHFKFGEFELDAPKRVLRRGGAPVALNSKTFDLLLALVENHGEVLTKDELLEKVWPGQFVEEGNLSVQIFNLRKIFGEQKNDHRFIVTVPGRGYSFVADLNGEPSGELVIESHSKSRIVVEETSDVSQPGTRLPGRALWAIAGLFVLLGGASGFFYLRQRQADISPDLSAGPLQIKRLTTVGKASVAALSPNGDLYVYALGTTGNPTSLWLGHTAGGEPIEMLPPANVWYHDVDFSSDGSHVYFVMSGAANPKGAIFSIPAIGKVPEKLVENIRTNVSYSPDMERFAFIKNDGERRLSLLVISGVRGEDVHELTSRPIESSFLSSTVAWSPDGKTIAVGAARDKENDNDCQLLAFNVENGEPIQVSGKLFSNILGIAWRKSGDGLVMSAIEPPQWDSQLWQVSFPAGEIRPINPDITSYAESLGISVKGDKLLALQKNTLANIWITSTDNLAGARQVTFGSINSRAGTHGLEWLPDGRIIFPAFTDRSQSLWVVSADGSTPQRLTPEGSIDQQPGVSSDGSIIVFCSNRQGAAEVWRVNADGSDLRQITSGGHNDMPTISPDGKWIVYVSKRDGLATIWKISADGGEPVRLADSYAAWPRISPDGKSVACVLNVDGKNKLAVIPIDGGTPPNLFDPPKTANFRFGLRWAPDGSALAFRDWEKGYWRQPLDGGPAARMEGLPDEKLFSFAWSRDQKLFAFSRGPEMRDVVLLSVSTK